MADGAWVVSDPETKAVLGVFTDRHARMEATKKYGSTIIQWREFNKLPDEEDDGPDSPANLMDNIGTMVELTGLVTDEHGLKILREIIACHKKRL